MLTEHTRMLITQAIAGTQSTAAIFFLLTSYLEAVRWHEAATTLPEALLHLPLRDDADVASRQAEASALHSRCVGEIGQSPPLVNELAAVLGAAMDRLRVLERSDTATDPRGSFEVP